MSHKTLINGTGYDIKGGRTLINGTGYDISFHKPSLADEFELVESAGLVKHQNASWSYKLFFLHDRFFAIGYYSYYSLDGINWIQITHPLSSTGSFGNGFVAAAYGNGVYVLMTSYSGVGVYSTDGVTWSTISSEANYNGVTDIIFANGVFVATPASGSNANTLVYSTDGQNWNTTSTEITLPTKKLTFCNGYFIISGSDGSYTDKYPRISYSTNGISWSTAKIAYANTNYLSRVGYVNGKYVVGVGSKGIYYTEDLSKTWTQGLSYPSIASWEDPACGNGLSVFSAGQNYWRSTDGINWTSSTLSIPTSIKPAAIVFVNEEFVCVESPNYYESSSNSNDYYCYSADALNWSTGYFNGGNETYLNWSNPVYGNGKYVTVSKMDGSSYGRYGIINVSKQS